MMLIKISVPFNDLHQSHRILALKKKVPRKRVANPLYKSALFVSSLIGVLELLMLYQQEKAKFVTQDH